MRFGSLAVFFILAAPCIAVPPAPPIDQVLANLAKSERAFENVRVEGVWYEQQQNNDGHSWSNTPIFEKFGAIFDGVPGSQGVINVSQSVAPWVDGDAPYGEASYSVGFDGSVGTWVSRTGGKVGATTRATVATLEQHPPGLLFGSVTCFASGAAFTAPLYDCENEQSLSAFIKSDIAASHKDGLSPTVQFDEAAGPGVLEISVPSQFVTDRWWIDSARGYSFLKSESEVHRNGIFRLQAYREVQELSPVGNGLYYPVSGFYLTKRNNGYFTHRIVFAISRCIVNDKTITDTTFKLKIPEGYTVTDRITGKTYLVGPSPEHLDDSLKEAIAQARKVGDAAAIDSGSMTQTHAKTNDNFYNYLWASISIGTIILCIVVFFCLKAFKRGKQITMIMLSVALIQEINSPKAFCANQEIDNAPQLHFVNCGLNSAFIALSVLGKELPTAVIADRMHIPPQIATSTSLYELKNLFETEHLAVKGVKLSDMSRLNQMFDQNTVIIVRQTTRDGDNVLDHFVTLIANHGRWLDVDPPRMAQVLPTSPEQISSTLRNATGEVLVVSQPPVVVLRNGPSIDIESSDIHVQWPISAGDTMNVPISIRNIGNSVLTIGKVSGPCSCYTGVTGELMVAPGQVSVLSAKFDRNKMPSGSVNRELVIASDDPQKAVIAVSIRFDIKSFPTANEPRLEPTLMRFGRKTLDELISFAQPITLVVPNADSGDDISVDVGYSNAKITVSKQSELYDSVTRNCRIIYNLKLNSVPAGDIDEQIRFSIHKPASNVNILVLKITGQIKE